MIAAVVAGAIMIYSIALIPMLRKREKVRNIAGEINAVLPASVPLYAIDPDYQPALFYVRDPIVYLGRVGEAPAEAKFLLVQPGSEAEALRSEQWAPRKARARLRLRDYRKKEIILLEVLEF